MKCDDCSYCRNWNGYIKTSSTQEKKKLYYYTCSVVQEVKPDPDTLSRRSRMSYDTLYWRYIYAPSSNEYEAFQDLIAAVSLEMEPGEGSWVHTPDPLQIEKTQNSISKMTRKTLTKSISPRAIFVHGLLGGAVLCVILSIFLGIKY